MPNTKIIAAFLIMLIWNLGYCQKQVIELDLKDKKIDYFIGIEKKLGSKPYETDTEYLSPGDVAQPKIFLRKEKNIPDLLVYYTFRKSDSIVTTIQYEWDVYNFEKEDNNVKPLSFAKNLISKYNEIISLISARYGKPETEGNLDDLSKINSHEGLKRNDKWNLKDDLKIYTYTNISNYYIKNGAVTVNPTHRIRLYIEKTSGDKPKELSKDQITILDGKFKQFITLLSENNFEKIKPLLSDKVKAQISNEILQQTKTGLQIERKPVLYMSGLQIMQDGNFYPMLQYNYSDDTNSPPLEYIKVLFDTDNTLLGLQPFKKQ